MQHSYFITLVLRAILAENPEIDKDGEFTRYTYETFRRGAELEIEWSRNILNDIEGIDLDEMEGYIKYLANKRLGMLGLPELYPGFTENVMPWIRTYSDQSFNATKTDFFEQQARTYTKTNDDNGFDDW